ncbi:MBL fold metallo-hydrolase [Halomarina salina]|uniref:MBL fold metallo-hydrolase n=1 Tax=Halomarina salina TaxID=1872699 RepID=A0ABD5RQD7_9EURY|nr:MBL fold metallo-hydrolase [Halomarina salina]
MQPPVRPVRVAPDTYLVDAMLFDTPGALSAYVLDADRPVLVDAGTADRTDRLLGALDALTIDPADIEAILVSHVHLDHAGGAGELARRCENATVYVHERGYDYVTDAANLDYLRASVDEVTGMDDPYGVPEVVPEDRTVAVSGGETLDLGDHTLRLVDAPGHAPHHYAVFDETTRALFTIDSTGTHVDGRLYPSTPPPFDLDANLATCDRLRDLDPSVNLYGHFGPGGDDPVSELDAYAALLPEWVELVGDLAAERGEDVGAIVDALDERWRSPTTERDVAGVLANR